MTVSVLKQNSSNFKRAFKKGMKAPTGSSYELLRRGLQHWQRFIFATENDIEKCQGCVGVHILFSLAFPTPVKRRSSEVFESLAVSTAASEWTQTVLIILGMAAFCVGVIAAVIHSSSAIRNHSEGRRVSCVSAGGFALDLLNIHVPRVIIQLSNQVIHFLFLSIQIRSRASRLLLIFVFAAAFNGLTHYCSCHAISG